MINTNLSDSAFGTFDFFGANGAPLTITVDGKPESSVDFALDHKDLHRFTISKAGTTMRTDYVRITAATHSTRFDSFALLSFKRNDVTVSTASLPIVQTGKAFQVFV